MINIGADVRKITLLFFIIFAGIASACFVAPEFFEDQPFVLSDCKLCKSAAIVSKGTSGGDTTMVVYVHGTILPYVSPKSIFAWVKSLIFGSYGRYLDQLKKYGKYKNQPMGELGLHPVNDFFGRQTSKIYKKLHDQVNQKDELLFYTFNWQGNLSDACVAMLRKSCTMLSKKRERD